MLDCQKHLFSIPDHISYLDAAYISPIPRIAEEAGRKGAGVKAVPWDMTIGNFYDEVEAARGLAAPLSFGALALEGGLADSQ